MDHKSNISSLFHDQGWEAWPNARLDEILNLSTSAKAVITKLQTLFIALVNCESFQMTQELKLFTVEFYFSNLYSNILSTLVCVCVDI